MAPAAKVLLEEWAARENAFQRALVVPLPYAEVVPSQLAAQLGVRPSGAMEELISAVTSAAAQVPRPGGATRRAATA